MEVPLDPELVVVDRGGHELAGEGPGWEFEKVVAVELTLGLRKPSFVWVVDGAGRYS
jgi:hypothetical protein